MIKVGFDIRPLIFTQAGIRTYLYNLIAGLARAGGCRLELFICAPSRIDWNAISADISEDVVRLPHLNDAWGRFWETFLLPRAVNRTRCDVFHGGRFFVPRRLSCPSIVSVHDVAFRRFRQFVTPRAFRYFDEAVSSSVRRAAKIIVPSGATASDLQTFYGVPEKKISVVYEAAGGEFSERRDADRIGAIKQKLGIKDRFILSVGTIEPRKNYPNLIKAYALLKGAKDLPLVICGGSGWLCRDVFETVERLGLAKRVIFAGHVDDVDLAQLYCACDLFVFPSLYEGFGLPVLEALQCGACVAASGTSSVRELFGNCVYQFQPGDPGSIAEAMERVLSDEALRSRLVSEGKKRSADFSWDKTARETLSVYHSVAGKMS